MTGSPLPRHVAAGRISGGRLTLYRTCEDGSTVPLTPEEIEALVELSRARRRRPFSTPPDPTRLALLLGHGDPAHEGTRTVAAGPRTRT
ncbi:hypothetical protein [Streptomyces sp. NPDC004658]|uniref:hypothetical protein n=1 Tax=Streptomyces sp. NPDC004658 TaxID=3154672 RepID=UPI0033AD0585